ncbi:MAG: hypothetical protein ABIF71_03395 [Planctomycetota bacterium]
MTTPHPITAGVPLEALPFEAMQMERFTPASDATVLIETADGFPVLAVRDVGKGRVATFAVRADSLTPNFSIPAGKRDVRDYRYWEVWYSLLNRAALWTAKRELKRDGAAVELALDAANRDKVLVPAVWKDANGAVTDWKFKQYLPPAAMQAEWKMILPATVPAGKPITLAFDPPPGYTATGYKVRLAEIMSDRSRTLLELAIDPATAPKNAAGQFTVAIPTDRMRRYCAAVTLMTTGTKVPGPSRTNEVIVIPDPAWEDYEAICWSGGGLPFLRSTEEARMRDLGLTGSSASFDDTASMDRLLRAGLKVHFLGYANGLHARNYDEAVRQWKITGDRKWLVREPSLADPAFWEKELARMAAVADAAAIYRPLQLIASDETSFTSYGADFDFDFHPANVDAFRAALKTRFATVEAMNTALGTKAASFEAVMPPLGEEARKDPALFGLFNAWRSYSDDLWAGTFGKYRQALRAKYPEARMSVSGTQANGVFNGIDWSKVGPNLDACCAYDGRFQILQRMSFRPGLKNTPWGGYGAEGQAVSHQLWSNLMRDGGGAALFWWYSLKNPDLTLSRSGESYRKVFTELKNDIGRQYQLADRSFSPVAVLWSPASQRAA